VSPVAPQAQCQAGKECDDEHGFIPLDVFGGAKQV
jgi:hypothetical protein